jgi:flagellar biosynthetic protein FlhB
MEDGDKTHDPTQHRRDEAREKGQLARSQDLASAAILVGGLMVLMFLGRELIDFLGFYTEHQLGGEAWLSMDAEAFTSEWYDLMRSLAQLVLPIMGLMMAIAILVNMAQVGILFLPDLLAPDIERLNPMKGVGRIFAISNVVRLMFGIIKIMIVSSVAIVGLYQQRDEIFTLVDLEVPQIAAYIVDVLYWITMKVGMALLILALLDYAYQKWKHEQDLRMSTQEIRDEMKNQQGNPQVISRRKQVQRQLALNRLSSAVPKADVVVTNPTELAVAIQYDPLTMNAPVVVAKGAGVMAQRIRRLALESGIPIVEKKPLAQALFKDVEVDHPVPQALYATVAEVLAYVYQLKGKKMPKLG